MKGRREGQNNRMEVELETVEVVGEVVIKGEGRSSKVTGYKYTVRFTVALC